MTAQASINRPQANNPPPDLFAAAFDCFYIDARPGGFVLLRIHGAPNEHIDVKLDAAACLTLESTLAAARARVNTQPLEQRPEQRGAAPQAQPHATMQEASAAEDHGSIGDPVTEARDAGDMQVPARRLN